MLPGTVEAFIVLAAPGVVALMFEAGGIFVVLSVPVVLATGLGDL